MQSKDIDQLEMPAGILYSVLKIASSLGLSVDKIVADFGLDLDSIFKNDKLTVLQFEILLEGLIALSPNKNFHLHLAQEFTFSHLDGLETLIFSGSTGEETIKEVLSYKELFLPLIDAKIESSKDYDLIFYTSNTSLPISHKYYYAEMVFVVMLTFGYRLLDKIELANMVERIEFRHSKPSYHDELEAFFNCSIIYGQRVDVAIVKKNVLKSAFKSQQQMLHNTARDILERRLKVIRSQQSIISKVENFVYQQLNNADLSIEAVSTSLSVSSRSLQRSLKEQGSSFSEIKNNVRLTTAKGLLKKTSRPLSEVSEALGFKDVSSFSRFFNRLEGCAPNRFRKNN